MQFLEPSITKYDACRNKIYKFYFDKFVYIVIITKINFEILSKESIILGIDPGTNILGFGLIKQNKKIELVDYGVFSYKKLDDANLKLKQIFLDISQLIENYKPTILSIEAPFYGKNVQSMLKLGRAQGVCIAAALAKDLEVFEYSPRKIKQAITGNGNASKEQVAKMINTILQTNIDFEYLDSSDALAVATCQYLQKKDLVTTNKYSGWKSFITDNPNRVK